MDFIAMALEMEPPSDAKPSAIQESIYAEAALLRRISERDGVTGRWLHDMQRNKPITVAMLRKPNSRPLLRLTFFGEECVKLSEIVTNTITESPFLELGEAQWRVGACVTSGSPWAAAASWADILTGEHSPRVQFHFETPTAFTKKDRRGNRVMSLYPDPKTLFTGLCWKWEKVRGVPLPPELSEYLAGEGCVVCGHTLQTISVKLHNRTQIGFIGTVLYECLEDDAACVTAINQLTRLAFFTGCGYQVSRGMGAVRTEIKRQL